MPLTTLSSGLHVIEIDHMLLQQASEAVPLMAIETALKSHQLAQFADTKDLPPALNDLFLWQRVERSLRNRKLIKAAILAFVSPLFFMFYAIVTSHWLLWAALFLSVPIAAIAGWLLWLRQTNSLRTKVAMLSKSTFITLIDSHLIENIPEMTNLREHSNRLQQTIAYTMTEEERITTLEKQLQAQRLKLNETGPDSTLIELAVTKEQQLRLRQQAQDLSQDIQVRLTQIEALRKKIRAQAELHFLRHQAQKISCMNGQQFAHQEMAELEVDREDILLQIDHFQQNLESLQLKLQGEYELSTSHPS